MPQRTPGPDCPLPRGGASLAASTCAYFSPRRLHSRVVEWAGLRLPAALTCRHLALARVAEGHLTGVCTHPALQQREPDHNRP